EDIYGVGVVEEMERDEVLIDRILNMDLRQLLLCINPPGFYSGTEDFENDNIKLRAGVVRRTLDPQGINFLKIPPPDKAALEMIQYIEDKEDSRTGINPLVEGEIPVQSGGKGSKATEFLVARESSLRKLQLPKHSLEDALGWEFMNRIALIQQVYSDFEVEHLEDETEIQDYLQSVNADRSFFFIENEGVAGKEKFYVKRFREMPLSVEQDESGQFLESEDTSFFKIKPEFLPWEGDIIIDTNAMLSNSDQLERQNTLQLAEILDPLFQGDPKINLKIAKQILLSFKKDPEKWFPADWVEFLRDPSKMTQQQQPQGALGAPGGPGGPTGGQPQPQGGGGKPAPKQSNTGGIRGMMKKIGAGLGI
ncbi:MAG TPA: hypothetical protein VNV63_07725, partial [Nitrospiria bacterium]|nr:hypothetical protein [Nitrospiria bacterium]